MTKKIKPFPFLFYQLWQCLGSTRRRQFWLLLMLMIFTSFAEMLTIGAVMPFLAALTEPSRVFDLPVAQPFIRLIGLSDASELLAPLTVLFILAAIFAGIMRLTLLRASILFSFAVGSELCNSVYRRTLHQPYLVHLERNSSEVINGVSIKTNEVIFYILIPTLNFIGGIVLLISLVSVLIFLAPISAISVFLIFGLMYAVVVKRIKGRLKVNSQNIALESNKTIQYLQEGLGGIRDILIDGTQEVFCAIYRNADQALRRAQGSNQFISVSPRFIMEAAAMVLIACVAYVVAQQSDGITETIPILAALALGMQRMLPASQQVYQAWSTIQGTQVSLQDTLELLKQPLPSHVDESSQIALEFKRELSLNGISFRYKPEAPYILKNIDLVIPKGSRIGIIGTTGSGKTTLIDIVMGLLDPTEGVMVVDGEKITSRNLKSWRKHIGHVPQSVFLTDGTVQENIAFGVPADAVDAMRVHRAAGKAQLATTIEAWPLRYQNFVGERGSHLSGGQQQRVGIARALYKEADLLIFDEATSALDNLTEASIMREIETLGKDITVIVVAHRLNVLENYDQVLEIKDGCLVKRKFTSND
jgi:ABC-type multidrug transport system fused ATPase/permease subunit